MNIQQLRYVVATAELGSMTAAAARLYVAQPALSRAVRGLERELGLDLFARSAAGVRATPAGEEFVAAARKVLRGLDALRAVGDTRDPDAQVVIAATPTLQASMAVPILRALREQGITVHTRLLGAGGAREVHELVAGGRADLGICDQTLASDLALVPLGRAEVRLFCPLGSDLPDPITLAQVAGVPLVLPTAGTERRAALDAFFESAGVVPTVAVESDERSVWLESVLSGLASCIWHSVEALHAPAGGYDVRRFDPPMYTELSAVHRDELRSEPAALLLGVIRDLAVLAG
ncbi:MAG: LysR family transcriptional regulator [Nocardioidaceae bacterium]|nr:LysR family transcriptional regulator [Nocardioidaceae bacterium]